MRKRPSTHHHQHQPAQWAQTRPSNTQVGRHSSQGTMVSWSPWSGYSCSGHNIYILNMINDHWSSHVNAGKPSVNCCDFSPCLWLIVHCSIVTFWARSSEALIALSALPYPVLTLTRAAVARLSPYIRLDVMWSQHNSCSYPGPWLLQCAAHTSASSNQSTAHSSPPQ